MTEPTDKIDEQPLDEYLKGDSSVSRRYRQLSSEDVPPSLDRLVLRQAEDAVKRPSRPAWMRWTAPLAVAASAVLVVSIVIETGMREETIVSAPTTMQQKRAAEAAMERRMSQESAEVPPPPKLEVPPPEVALADVQADAAPAFAPEPPAPAPVAAPAAAPTPQRKALAHQPVTRETSGALLPEQMAKAERQKSELEEAARAQQLAASQRARGDEEKEDAADPRDTLEAMAPTTVLSYSRPARANASSATGDSRATLQKTYTDPEAWLQDIRQLRKDNKQDEADREWRRFLAAFPNHEVAETDAAREAK
jgi:hypothetical protein